MTQRLESPAARTGWRVVAEGPAEKGPEFVVGGLVTPAATPAWQVFYAAEQDPARRIPPEEADQEHSYDQLTWVSQHTILDAAGQPCVPVVSRIALMNEGYVCTWSQLFWREGYCVHEGRPAFLSIGEDVGFGTFHGVVRYVTGGAGEPVDRAGLERFLDAPGWPVDEQGIAKLAGLLRP